MRSVEQSASSFQQKENPEKKWRVVERVGFLGKNRDQKYGEWDEKYGAGNWKLGWQLASGEQLDFMPAFQLYVDGYVAYFQERPEEALYIIQNYAYCFDKTPITKEQAFDPEFLVGKSGLPNQFHHVALNLALLQLGYEFQGEQPLQVRDGKVDQPRENWPAGWKWGPGYIPASDATLIPKTVMAGWWQPGTIEDLYQKAKVLLVSA